MNSHLRQIEGIACGDWTIRLFEVWEERIAVSAVMEYDIRAVHKSGVEEPPGPNRRRHKSAAQQERDRLVALIDWPSRIED